jgi:hypothetical protein
MRVLVAVAALAFAVGGLSAALGCSSSSSSTGSGAGTPSCTSADGTLCPTGAGALQLCVTGGNGQCTGAYFTVGSQTFNCNSCTDTTGCEEQAAAVCYVDGGSGSSSGSQDASGG